MSLQGGQNASVAGRDIRPTPAPPDTATNLAAQAIHLATTSLRNGQLAKTSKHSVVQQVWRIDR
ncbi:hypothetical protein MMEU_2716 [Mycobacterium marinum str. Europe]|nr:hypothetical protein MMEU_2716 [Mycobacterium marinum str. Europe]